MFSSDGRPMAKMVMTMMKPKRMQREFGAVRKNTQTPAHTLLICITYTFTYFTILLYPPMIPVVVNHCLARDNIHA